MTLVYFVCKSVEKSAVVEHRSSSEARRGVLRTLGSGSVVYCLVFGRALFRVMLDARELVAGVGLKHT